MTQLCVSRDGSLAAHVSMDGCVRVHRLEGMALVFEHDIEADIGAEKVGILSSI